jgi:(1->4)-alpha-D-glucan 1-alpha-D-glucosylmutase
MVSSPAILYGEATGVSECLDRLSSRRWQNRPLATYRLQFSSRFRFEDARRIAPYLHQLGVTHCYASPILEARPGSPHGYDIINHNAINPDLGSEAEFHEFARELQSRGMGLVLDVVPNHMGVGEGTNPWWQDVLENGRASAYASFFDIDWWPLRAELHGKVLLPILGDQYGVVLESGQLRLEFSDGRFTLAYFERRLPIDPRSYTHIFEAKREAGQCYAPPRPPDNGNAEADLAELDSILAALRALPPHDTADADLAAERHREWLALRRRLALLAERSPAVQAEIAAAVRLVNGTPGVSRSFNALNRLLEQQAYRMAHWRVSAEEINYRRFFDINDLIGLRMENPQVFAETHRLIRRLLADGSVSGLRVDHPDGLFNPIQYFTRVQMLYAASQCGGPEPRSATAENGIEKNIEQVFGSHDWIGAHTPLFVLVEKILEPDEELPREWPVDGTVGYDFTNLVNGVFIQPRSERALTTLYRRFGGYAGDVPTLIYQSKKLVMNSAMSSEVTVLTHLLAEICRADRQARDFTLKSLADATREAIACFPVYRTYIDERGNISERDRQTIHAAIANARRRNEATPVAVFNFLRDILVLKPQPRDNADSHRRRLYFALKFQQLTGPVMAKGLEDTACYVYNRFVSVNEVGGSPGAFATSVDEFHSGNMERAERWPFSMLSTSTHDTKRSEDVRARLNVISEMPREWAAHVMRWRRMNRARKRTLADGRAVPDHNEEYLLYQTLVGVWPFVLPGGRGALGDEEHHALVARVQDYMTKAVHEAKVNLSWVNPNEEYVQALREFVGRILERGKAKRWRAPSFVQQLEAMLPAVQFHGAMNSLAQTALKMAAPGMPDFYQGTELWDFSLVDPDNRRPVDFARRQQMLSELEQRANGASWPELCSEVLRDWTTGAVKMWTVLRGLRFRRENPELFQHGGYTPLFGLVERQEHMCAFSRTHERQMCIVAVPRFSYTLMKGSATPPVGDAWGAAELGLPPRAPAEFTNILTGERIRVTTARTLLGRELFAHFPIALLASH